MKLYATVENEKGKRAGVGGSGYLDIDIRVGNSVLAMFTVRYTDDCPDGGSGWALYDDGDEIIKWVEDKGKKQKGECMNKDGNGNACYDCESGQGMECGSTEEC